MKVQGGESLLKELGIYNSHITSFTQQLRQNGWDLDATPVIREEPAFETVEVPEPDRFETVLSRKWWSPNLSSTFLHLRCRMPMSSAKRTT